MMAKNFALTTDESGSEWLSCKNYKSIIKDQEKSVVVFFAQDCEVCHQLINNVDSIGEKPGISWAFVDVDVCNKAADGAGIDATPTVVVNSKGREVYRLNVSGNVKKDLAQLSSYLDTL
jgi:thioredoxin-like negative regulator of GroEL